MKNAIEAQGMIDCHVRDGIALCKYFAWLEDALKRGENVDEISGATKLQSFREFVLQSEQRLFFYECVKYKL